MAIADLLTSIAEKIQRVYALKDQKPYINSLEITDFRYFNQENARESLLDKCDFSNGTNFFNYCWGAKELVTVNADFPKGSQLYGAFDGCTSLETVVNLNCTSNATLGRIFYNCTALKNITVVQNRIGSNISFSNSPLLTDASIQSIIDGLRTITSSKKITLHSDVSAKLTTEQLEQIYNKGWEIG